MKLKFVSCFISGKTELSPTDKRQLGKYIKHVDSMPEATWLEEEVS